MRKLLIFPVLLLFSCSASVSDWRDTYRYVEKTETPHTPVPPSQPEEKKSVYEQEVQQKLLHLLREKPTPLAVPPTVLRIFVLPYVDERGNLVTDHYIYVKVDEGRWIMGDYLLKRGMPLREFTPLEQKEEPKKEEKNGK